MRMCMLINMYTVYMCITVYVCICMWTYYGYECGCMYKLSYVCII